MSAESLALRVAGLRRYADLLTAHPELERFIRGEESISIPLTSEDPAGELAVWVRAARAAGLVVTRYESTYGRGVDITLSGEANSDTPWLAPAGSTWLHLHRSADQLSAEQVDAVLTNVPAPLGDLARVAQALGLPADSPVDAIVAVAEQASGGGAQ